jgi:hypothetical protein
MTRASGLPSAGVPVAVCGFAACTFLTPSGIPVPPTKARADSYFAKAVLAVTRGVADCTATRVSFIDAARPVG